MFSCRLIAPSIGTQWSVAVCSEPAHQSAGTCLAGAGRVRGLRAAQPDAGADDRDSSDSAVVGSRPASLAGLHAARIHGRSTGAGSCGDLHDPDLVSGVTQAGG